MYKKCGAENDLWIEVGGRLARGRRSSRLGQRDGIPRAREEGVKGGVRASHA